MELYLESNICVLMATEFKSNHLKMVKIASTTFGSPLQKSVTLL